MSLSNFNTDPTPISSLISIPTPIGITNATHSLELHVEGPPRTPGHPVVLIMTGHASAITEWAGFIRLISSHVRVVAYNRAGLGQSDESGESNPPRPEIVAEELESLLKASGIEGPWVVVGHSWGGITSREFLERVKARKNGQGVVGMVLVDTVGAEWRRHDGLAWPTPEWTALLGDRFPEVDVFFPDKESRQGLTDHEWEAYLEEENSDKHRRQASKEAEVNEAGERTLMEKKHLDEETIAEKGPILEDWPVSVLQATFRLDLQKCYNYGVEHHLGTDKERQAARRWMEEFDSRAEKVNRRQLNLSRNGRFKMVNNSGHNVQMRNPEAIVEEVLWVLETIKPLLS
ncbi:MAG: hypothetical protein Q9160_002223 [Pyrenula sp. 1 TL-2023]